MMGGEWKQALEESRASAFEALRRYEALLADVPELARLEGECERAALSDDGARLIELARARDKALEALPRIWAARERWRVLWKLVENLEAQAKENMR